MRALSAVFANFSRPSATIIHPQRVWKFERFETWDGQFRVNYWSNLIVLKYKSVHEYIYEYIFI